MADVLSSLPGIFTGGPLVTVTPSTQLSSAVLRPLLVSDDLVTPDGASPALSPFSALFLPQ